MESREFEAILIKMGFIKEGSSFILPEFGVFEYGSLLVYVDRIDPRPHTYVLKYESKIVAYFYPVYVEEIIYQKTPQLKIMPVDIENRELSIGLDEQITEFFGE